jgi:hypothetical protein
MCFRKPNRHIGAKCFRVERRELALDTWSWSFGRRRRFFGSTEVERRYHTRELMLETIRHLVKFMPMKTFVVRDNVLRLGIRGWIYNGKRSALKMKDNNLY